MRWTKIKNIILLILVTVNIFLLALVGVRAWRTAQNERQTRTRMLQILENNGIRFDPQELPRDMSLTAKKLTLTPLGETDAAVLLGDLFTAENQGTRTLYTGERGTLSLSPSGEALWELSPDSSLTEAELWTALRELGLSFREESRVQEGDTLTVTACHLWDGVPVVGEELRLTLRGSTPVSVSFRALRGTAETVSSATPITAATALLRLLDALNQQGYICSQISDLYSGYLLSGDTTLTLEPTWFVEIDTAPWRLAVNALTGTVTAQ